MQVDEKLPIVTVVIPCHNHQRWIGAAIRSVVNQDYPNGNMRIMVVDDGSDDVSFECAYGTLETKSKIIEHPDGVLQVCGSINDITVIALKRPKAGGPSVARNLGMTVGMDGTDIFAFLDSDDMYQPRKIAESIKKFLVSEKIGAVYSDYDTVRECGLRIREFKEPFSRDRMLRECIVNCNSLVLKDAVVKCGMFDEEMRVCEDYDFWMRISEQYVISHIAESLVDIRVGDHSSSASVKPEIWQQNWRRVMEKAQQRQRAAGNAS